MTGQHLAPETLERLATHALRADEQAQASGHLRVCPLCRERLAALSPSGTQMVHEVLWQLAASQHVSDAYSAAFTHACQRLEAKVIAIARELEEAPVAVADLLALSKAERLQAAQSEPRFQTRAVVESLLEHCRKSWTEDLERAEQYADLAHELLEQLDTALYGNAAINDLRAQRWAYIGNVRRIRTDLRSVEDAFTLAESFLALGSGDPLVQAEVLDLQASLRRDQRRFDESVALLERAISAYRRAGDRHLVGRALLKEAMVHNEAGEPARSIALLRRACGMIDPVREPRLRYVVPQQLTWFLVQAGQFEEARQTLPEAARAAEEVGTRFDHLRLRWTEGLVLAGLGETDQAERLLSAARDGFISEGIGYDTALVSLDLAVLYLRQNRTAETRRLAEEMLTLFQARDIHREALAALMVFRRAAEIDTATTGMVEDIARYMRSARLEHPRAIERPS